MAKAKREKKTYIIRLYAAHDLDLITFMETHEFNITSAIYCALKAFSKHEAFVINIPPQKKSMPALARRYTRTLRLDVEYDADAIEVLNKIANGYRNNFLKNLLRQYLCYPLSEAFLSNPEDIHYFNDGFSIFRDNRRLANAGKLTKEDKKNFMNYISSVTQENEPDAPISPPTKAVSPKTTVHNKKSFPASGIRKESVFNETVPKPLSNEKPVENTIPAPDSPVSDDVSADDLTAMFAGLL